MAVLVGCGGSPSAANIQLRKQNQSLQDQIAQLNRQHQADAATIQNYEQHHPTVPSLPQDRLATLFTAHGLEFGRLTSDYSNADGSSRGLQVEIVPIDDQGDSLKAAGSFKIEAFDLAEPNHPLVGTWNFDPAQARTLFYDHFALYTYVLPCPWPDQPPAHRDLTIKATFNDELTGRQFTAQRVVHLALPTTQSASG